MLIDYNNQPKGYDRRIYVDHKKRIFCDTHVPANVDIEPIVGTNTVLNIIVSDLRRRGYQQASRRAFEALLRE